MQIINVHAAKAQLSALIRKALAGEEVFIAKAGEPVVKLTPVYHDPRPREGGQMRGKIWISPDFDAPDPEFEELFYGSKIFPGEPDDKK